MDMSNITLSDLASQKSMLLFLWLKYTWELYLNIRQYQVYKTPRNVPFEVSKIMNKDTFERARRYSIDKSKLQFANNFFSVVKSTVVICFGLLAELWTYSEAISPWTGEAPTSCVWAFLVTMLSTVLDLPFIIYSTFVIEAKYGFNKQTVAFFMVDQGKLFVFEQAVALLVSEIILAFVEIGGEFFFIWLWLVVAVLFVVFQIIFPLYIAPFFDKFSLLPDNDQLKDDIEDLASELHFPLGKIYVVDGSLRSGHSNAYFAGLFGTKIVVLYDTLLTGNSNDEILAILGHEFGHWKCNHVPKRMFVILLHPLLVFFAFANLLSYSPMYAAVGFSQSQPALVGLFVVNEYVMLPCTTLLSFLQTWFSRCDEYEADRFSVKLGMAKDLQSALIQLYKDNLAFPVYDPWYSAWYMDHPTLLQRLEAINSK